MVMRGYNESCAYNGINLIDSQNCSFSVIVFFFTDDNSIKQYCSVPLE
jgi:hypothetical protein